MSYSLQTHLSITSSEIDTPREKLPYQGHFITIICGIGVKHIKRTSDADAGSRRMMIYLLRFWLTTYIPFSFRPRQDKLTLSHE